MSGRIGIVVGVNSDDGSYDVLMLDNGAQLVGVQHLSQDGTGKSGSTSLLPIPARANKWDVSQGSSEDYTRAVIGFASGHPYIQGFLRPQVNQMLFKDPNLRVLRHADVLTTIDGDGNVEMAHPSGAYIRIGETPDHVDLTGKNADGNLALTQNTGRQVSLRVALAGNAVKLTMTPEGLMTFELEQDFNIKAGGAINMEAGKAITLKSPEQIVVDAPGGVKNPSGDIVAQTVSLQNHLTTQVQGGNAVSGPPQA